mgnify:CR=1 FL=1
MRIPRAAFLAALLLLAAMFLVVGAIVFVNYVPDSLSTSLFGLAFARADVPVWHPSVECWEVREDGRYHYHAGGTYRLRMNTA